MDTRIRRDPSPCCTEDACTTTSRSSSRCAPRACINTRCNSRRHHYTVNCVLPCASSYAGSLFNSSYNRYRYRSHAALTTQHDATTLLSWHCSANHASVSTCETRARARFPFMKLFARTHHCNAQRATRRASSARSSRASRRVPRGAMRALRRAHGVTRARRSHSRACHRMCAGPRADHTSFTSLVSTIRLGAFTTRADSEHDNHSRRAHVQRATSVCARIHGRVG